MAEDADQKHAAQVANPHRPATGAPASPDGLPARRELMKLWQVLLVALGAHIVIFLALSPGLYSRDDNSPEGLLGKARAKVEAEDYEEALKLYQTMLLKKPQLPAFFVEAEKEMHSIRLKALEAQRQAAEGARVTAGGDESGDGPPTDPATKPSRPAGEPGEPVKPPPRPDVNLPSLPEIGGEL